MKSTALCRYALLSVLCTVSAATGEDGHPTRCEIVPLAGHQVSFKLDGAEKLRWNFGSDYPGPFFFPVRGPSGAMLTRMGHPGAPDHDHHRSVWFAHHNVEGQDFWSHSAKGRIRQQQWYAYQNGDDEAVMAVRLSWTGEDSAELLQQDLVAALRAAGTTGEYELEIQSEFRPGRGRSATTLEQSNFGIFAVRVAASVSGYFGGGTIRSSEDATGEKQIFGKRARWVDYSGPVTVGSGSARTTEQNGVAYLSHPSNDVMPPGWHVREDGWMTASASMYEPKQTTAEEPLLLRYVLYSHRDDCPRSRIEERFAEFSQRSAFQIRKAVRGKEPHRHFVVERITATPDAADSADQ